MPAVAGLTPKVSAVYPCRPRRAAGGAGLPDNIQSRQSRDLNCRRFVRARNEYLSPVARRRSQLLQNVGLAIFDDCLPRPAAVMPADRDASRGKPRLRTASPPGNTGRRDWRCCREKDTSGDGKPCRQAAGFHRNSR